MLRQAMNAGKQRVRGGFAAGLFLAFMAFVGSVAI
jgi:hypothetical protein